MKRILKFSVVVPAVQVGVGVGVAVGAGAIVGAGVALCTGVGAGAIVGAGVGAVGTGVGVETGALGVAVAVGVAVGVALALGVGVAVPLVEVTGVRPEFALDPAAVAASKNCWLGFTIQPVMMRLTESKPRVEWIDDFIKNSFTINPYLNGEPERDELQGFLNNIKFYSEQLNEVC
jgi:hypothetical protein